MKCTRLVWWINFQLYKLFYEAHGLIVRPNSHLKIRPTSGIIGLIPVATMHFMDKTEAGWGHLVGVQTELHIPPSTGDEFTIFSFSINVTKERG